MKMYTIHNLTNKRAEKALEAIDLITTKPMELLNAVKSLKEKLAVLESKLDSANNSQIELMQAVYRYQDWLSQTHEELAEIAERDRWRVTANEPPTDESIYYDILSKDNLHYNLEFHGSGKFLFGISCEGEFLYTRASHWRPSRTDRPSLNP